MVKMWLKSEICKYSCSFTCEEWSHNRDVTQWFVASVFFKFSCEFVWNSICVIFAFVWETFWHGSFKTVKDPIVWYTRLINHFRVFGISILLGKISPCKNWNLTYEKCEPFLVFMAWIICRFWKKVSNFEFNSRFKRLSAPTSIYVVCRDNNHSTYYAHKILVLVIAI